jgi:hypothetical protein
MNDLLSRFTSRKFLLAVFGILYGIKFNQPEIMQASLIAFMAAEGVSDAAGRLKPRQVSSDSIFESISAAVDDEDDDDLDKTRLVAGSDGH